LELSWRSSEWIGLIGRAVDPLIRATQALVADETIDQRVEAPLNSKVAAMSKLLDDPELVELCLPDYDDPLSITDLFLDGGNRTDPLMDPFRPPSCRPRFLS
jgi:hypothetical protein